MKLNHSEVFAKGAADGWREFYRGLFTRPVRQVLNRIPGLPMPMVRFLDEVRFFEPEVTRILTRLIQPGWVCADIGAHSGTLTVRLAEYSAPGGKVFAFEPIPQNFQSLQARVASYGYEDRVKTNRLALSDCGGGTLELYPGDHTTTWSIFGQETVGNDRVKTTVPVVRLDDFFPSGSRLDFIKMDVEGAEHLVLAGATRVLTEARPALLIEFHNAQGWTGSQYLWDRAYRLFELDGRELSRGAHPTGAYGHCLALPD